MKASFWNKCYLPSEKYILAQILFELLSMTDLIEQEFIT